MELKINSSNEINKDAAKKLEELAFHCMALPAGNSKVVPFIAKHCLLWQEKHSKLPLPYDRKRIPVI